MVCELVGDKHFRGPLSVRVVEAESGWDYEKAVEASKHRFCDGVLVFYVVDARSSRGRGDGVWVAPDAIDAAASPREHTPSPLKNTGGSSAAGVVAAPTPPYDRSTAATTTSRPRR